VTILQQLFVVVENLDHQIQELKEMDILNVVACHVDIDI
jgi:hypothetical protein